MAVQGNQLLQKPHLAGTSPQTGNDSLMVTPSVPVHLKFLLSYRLSQIYLRELFDMDELFVEFL